MLAAQGLVKRYGPRTVVNGVAVKVEHGETVGLLGPNGAGKTTTFYMIVGLVRPDAGDVFLDGKALTTMPVHERARRGIGYLPQDPSVVLRLTVHENILMILHAHGTTKAAHTEIRELLLPELCVGTRRR